jgi:hypothetical protein
VAANQEKTDTNLEEMDSFQEEMKAMLETCLEKMELNPEGIKAVAEHQDVPNEEAAVETVRALEDQSGDQQLAVGCCSP